MLSGALIVASLLPLHIEVQAWTRTCDASSPTRTLDCQIPVAYGEKISLSALVEVASTLGHSHVTKLAFGDGNFGGEIRLYSVYPNLESGYPPYIQIQIETISPTRSLCLQSARLRRPFEASPLSCTGFDTERGRQLGVNVKLWE